MSDKQNRLYGHLRVVGDKGTRPEFEDALKKFGGDADAVDALAKGLAQGQKRESYNDYATPEYYALQAKEEALRDFELCRGVFERSPASSLQETFTNQATHKAAESGAVEKLTAAVEKLSARIEALEQARPSSAWKHRL